MTSTTIETVSTTRAVAPKKDVFKVFLSFNKPDGTISAFIGDGTLDCGVYAALGKIFNRSALEISRAIAELVFKNGSGFMQQYDSMDAATYATAQASLFSHKAKCFCFLKQEARFRIEKTN